MDTTSTRHGRASPYFIFSALCLALIAALIVPAYVMSTAAHSVIPSPREQPPGVALASPVQPEQQGRQEKDEESGQFPIVDWHYWQSINPSIVGWVTVPDTNIDYAVVQAPKDDATYYLTHDIYRNWNPYGCPYVDAGCEGAAGFNTVIFGHNMGYDKSMFSDFASYSDVAFAKEHSRILFQTPAEKLVLDVSAVSIVKGTEQSKRTGFTNQAELSSWYEAVYEKAEVRLSNNFCATGLFTFVTCSYHRFSNERTLVFAQSHTDNQRKEKL